MIYDIAVVNLEGAGGLHCPPPFGSVHSFFFIAQHSCFDNTLYFHITFMPRLYYDQLSYNFLCFSRFLPSL